MNTISDSKIDQEQDRLEVSSTGQALILVAIVTLIAIVAAGLVLLVVLLVATG